MNKYLKLTTVLINVSLLSSCATHDINTETQTSTVRYNPDSPACSSENEKQFHDCRMNKIQNLVNDGANIVKRQEEAIKNAQDTLAQ